MNLNSSLGARSTGPGRKVKRVSDVNAMGAPAPAPAASPYLPNAFDGTQQQNQYPQTIGANGLGPGIGVTGVQMDQIYPQQQQNLQQLQQPQQQFNYNAYPQQQQQQQQQPNQPQQYPGYSDFNQPQQPTSTVNMMGAGIVGGVGGGPQQNVPFGVFQQPIVQDMAMQYGQRLADQGKQMVESHIEKYVPIARLKYYFAVDTKYVINKLRLLFFPFTHSDWSLKYDQDNPVQPRYDINAPDLYIPTMAYITYVVLAGLVLGMQNKFTPEDLGKQASTALAVILLELLVYTITLYVTNIPTTLRTLDLLAYSGYKFSTLVMCIVASILFNNFGYWIALGYGCAPLAFFMTRTLYTKLKSSHSSADQSQMAQQIAYDAYGVPLQQPQQFNDYNAAKKRKFYFTGFVVAFQILITWWLSWHLVPPSVRASLNSAGGIGIGSVGNT